METMVMLVLALMLVLMLWQMKTIIVLV